MRTASRGHLAWTENALPVRRWQARQWQTETRTGSPSTSARSWPQLHLASCVAIGQRLELIEYVSSVTDTEYLEITRSGEYDGLMGHCRQVIRGG